MDLPKEITDVLIFFICALLGMLFAYIKRWGDTREKNSLAKYLVGDSRAVARACTTLTTIVGSSVVAGHLDTLSFTQIITAGIGIGIMVPSVVDENKESNRFNLPPLKDLKNNE